MERLRDEVAALGLELSDRQLSAFDRYRRLLQEWNQHINLTSIDDDDGIRLRHFLDSLACATVTGNLNERAVIDVGAGAGFPGLPLKILYPRMALSLVESVTKKARFLRTVVEELALQSVQVLDNRAEFVGQDPAFRERYDWAVARAVAPLNILVEYLLPLCRVGGNVLAMKGERGPAEVEEARAAIDTLGGAQPVLHPLRLAPRDEQSYLVQIEKIAPTPQRYPRRPGIPAKRPLS